MNVPTNGNGHVTVEQMNGHDHRPILITGGAGFIGTNVAHRFLQSGQRVIIYDNLSRDGVERNLAWLECNYGDLVQVEIGDVRNENALRKLVRGVSKVFHFAAQVDVPASLENPIEDFEVNARGTLNLLEAIRTLPAPPQLIYTSSNKVYGDLSNVKTVDEGMRYAAVNQRIRSFGFSEARPLSFHSPYDCSKGSAAQFVLGYARTFRIPAVVFHMSCIYGPHQFGNEDQGWVTHFLIRSISDLPLTIYGDGKQVRDILLVEDLVDASLLAHQNMRRLSGQAFNIGGGPANTISPLELLKFIEEIQGKCPEIRFADWRFDDQKYYVSDIRKFRKATGWIPKTTSRDGIRQLYQWLIENAVAVPRVETNVARHRHPAMAQSV